MIVLRLHKDNSLAMETVLGDGNILGAALGRGSSNGAKVSSLPLKKIRRHEGRC